MQIEHQFFTTNGIRLHVASAGPVDGPLLLLLHGFPEFWRGWLPLITPLAAAGWRVWVPDLRGYNLSAKPQGIAAYNMDVLADDIIGLIDAAGVKTAVVAAHDWGGAVAWWLANRNPERLTQLCIVNAPHHDVFQQHLRNNWRQRLHSSYMLFFQLPWLPEWTMRVAGSKYAARILRRSARRGAFDDAEMVHYRRAWQRPGAATGMLNYYRAIFRHPPRPLSGPIIDVPTLIIWGRADPFLQHVMAEASVDLCTDGRLVFIDHATHWIIHEEPQAVAEHLLAFIGSPSLP